MTLPIFWAIGLLWGGLLPTDDPEAIASLPLSLADDREEDVRLLAPDWRRATFREVLGELPTLRSPQDPSKPDDKKAAAVEFVAPHDSFGGFFDSHFCTARPWEEAVVDGYLTQPAILIPVLLLAGAGAVSHWDSNISRDWQGSMGGHKIYGDVGMYVLVGSSVILGGLFPGPGRNTWDELWTQAEAFGLTAGITEILKISVGRIRPNGFGGSLPSGHASTAFAGATLIERNFGELASIPAYAVATLVAFSRVESGWHFPSDVLAGAAIGILMTRIIDDLHWGPGGIARPQVDVKVGGADGRGGVEVGVAFGF
jgi:membrane-associated phospholipid phosphatase